MIKILLITLLLIVGCENEEQEQDDIEYFPNGEILSPSSPTVGRVVSILVNATDELGINRVEIFINDNFILADNTEPYEYLWNTFDDGEGQYEIKAVIYNQDENFITDSVNVEVVISNLFIPMDFPDLSNEIMLDYLDSGDTISVSSGTYYGYNLNFTNYPNLNFIGVDGADNVILDGGGQGRVLAVSESLVQGFTIQNGLATDNGGGGILLYGSTLRNCIIRDNECTWSTYSRGGGGIEAIYTCTIENNLIYGNQCQYVGGGLHLAENGNYNIINNVFYNNSIISGWGGGVYIHMGSATIMNNIFSQNNGGNLVSHNNNDFGEVSYNNIGMEDSWGQGNIYGDPLFFNQNDGDFHLQSISPCIDTGHPDSNYNDPDGTRNDMGAYGGPYGD